MPDKQQHRGQHPQDGLLFAPKMLPRLRDAVSDYSWLLERDYASKSALELVGNRYQLPERQRLAVMRSACSDSARMRRNSSEVGIDSIARQTIFIDGYNLLTTVEAALSGGVIIVGRDGCYRDIASMHSTFRRVEETLPAMTLIGQVLAELKVGEVVWFLDSPVSNSGRLKGILLEVAAQHRWNWSVEVVMNPDPVLALAEEIIVTADSVILDQCRQWCNLARHVVTRAVPDANIIDLSL